MSNVRCNHVLPNLAVFDVSEYRVIMNMYYEYVADSKCYPRKQHGRSPRRMLQCAG